MAFYKSKFTGEEIDQRLTQGAYDDAVNAGFKGTKEEFDQLTWAFGKEQQELLKTAQQQKADNLETESKNIVEAINEVYHKADNSHILEELSQKQNIQDDNLQTSNKTIVGAINEIKESVDSISDPYEINITNLLSAEDSESISTAIGGIDNLNATVQDNRIIVGTVSNGSVSVSIRILGNVTTLYYLLDSVVGLTLNEIAITNTSGTLSKSITTHSVLTENMVINSLTSDETTLPLSAAQGKVLDNKINTGLSAKQDTLTAGTGIEITPENQINVTLDTNVFFVAESVSASPTEEQKKKICLVPADTTEEGNFYTEYVWVVDDEHPNGYWEEFGTYKSEVDLTPYLKIEDAASTYLSKTEAQSAYQPVGDYATNTALNVGLAGKQPTGDYALKSDLPVVTDVPTLAADYTVPANATSREYVYNISVGATVYNITGAEGIKWADGVAPIATANSTIVVSVMNNLAVWGTF